MHARTHTHTHTHTLSYTHTLTLQPLPGALSCMGVHDWLGYLGAGVSALPAQLQGAEAEVHRHGARDAAGGSNSGKVGGWVGAYSCVCVCVCVPARCGAEQGAWLPTLH